MNKITMLAVAGLVVVTSLVTVSNAQATTPPVVANSLAPMLKNILPAVVNVAAQGEIVLPSATRNSKEQDQQNQNSDSDAPYSPYGKLREFASLGSGVVVDAAKGYILTNAHVIDHAKTITVTLSDGRDFKAKLIGADAASDIAVLQIPSEKLTQMAMGDSQKLQVGDFVVAIGNPYGLSQTVTSGIVSALQRGSLGIEGPQGLENFIQTDASINPGNSGGALVNTDGQLIGINTAILAPDGGNVGIGFAIPIDMARVVMSQLIQYGSVKRGLMGVIVQDVTPDLANAFGIAGQKGAVITQVTPDSPAAAADLKAGDIVQELNGQPMRDASAVRNAVGLLRVGAKIQLKILRDGDSKSISLVTADPDKYLDTEKQQNPFLFGLSLKDFDQQTPIQGRIVGVQVLSVSKNSAAWLAGLMRGDVIVAANKEPVTTVAQLQKAAGKDKKRLLLNVLRGTGALFVVVD